MTILIGTSGNDTLTGGTGDDTLYGGLGDDSIYGGDGNDDLDYTYAEGDDTLYGGKGNDKYFIYSWGGSDTIIEYEDEGNDSVYTNISFTLAGIANVENLYAFYNSTTNLSLTGNSLDNWIQPSKGVCTIDGGAGSDTVNYSNYWAKNECVIFKENNVLKVTKGNGNTDTIYNCENLYFSDQIVVISQLQLGLVVSEFTPAQNATEIAVASDITVTFSEAIKRGTGDITLKTSDGTVVATYDAASSTNLTISDKTLTINPTDNLSSDITYQLVFDEGAIVDLNDNKYEQSGNYQFTTIEPIKPTLLSINGDITLQEDIVLTFSESIKVGTGSVVFTNTNTGASTEYRTASTSNISITGSTLTIAPSSLASSVTAEDIYTVEIDGDAVTDIDGNKYQGLTVIYGRSGDDIFSGEDGNNFISGGAGTDIVEYAWDRGDYLVSKEPDSGRIYVANKLGEDLGYVLDDTELLSFRDIEVDTDALNYWGKVSPVDPDSESPIYRFFNTRDNAFFYTDSADERDYVIDNSSVEKNNIDEWPYVYQGGTFEAAHSYTTGLLGALLGSDKVAPVYRFYNTDTGHHFFTISDAEADLIKGKIASGEWPFNYEGTRFSVYSVDPTPNFQGEEIAVHRFYSPTLNRHFFTADTEEVNLIQLTGVWDYEGIAFWGEVLG